MISEKSTPRCLFGHGRQEARLMATFGRKSILLGSKDTRKGSVLIIPIFCYKVTAIAIMTTVMKATMYVATVAENL